MIDGERRESKLAQSKDRSSMPEDASVLTHRIGAIGDILNYRPSVNGVDARIGVGLWLSQS
jgi:hypothetical protein